MTKRFPVISRFSDSHRSRNEAIFVERSFSSDSIPERRSRDPGSVSFSSACRSISSWVLRRSTSSISVGTESISIFRRDAASSTRSIALSGRNRSEMYRWDKVAAAISAESLIRTPWCTS